MSSNSNMNIQLTLDLGIDKLDDRFNIAAEYGFTFTPPKVHKGRFVDGKLQYLDSEVIFGAEALDDTLAATGWPIRQCIEQLVAAAKYELGTETKARIKEIAGNM